MANPQSYTYTAAGARTVEAKLDIADMVVRVSIEEHPILSLLPRRRVQDPNPKKVEDNLQAIDTTNYHAEDSVAPAAASTARTLNTTACQLLKKTVTINTYQQYVAQYGVGKEFDYQQTLRLIELAKDAEAFIISDQAVQLGTPANGRIWKMKGMGNIISTNTNTVANFNQANFEALVKAVFGTSGGNPTVCFVDLTRKLAIASWTTNVTRYTDVKDLVYNDVQTFMSAYGLSIQIRPHRYMPQSIVGNGAVAIALDLQKAGWEVLEYVPLTIEELAYTGGGKSAQIMWSLGVLPGAEKANFAFVG